MRESRERLTDKAPVEHTPELAALQDKECSRQPTEHAQRSIGRSVLGGFEAQKELSWRSEKTGTESKTRSF